MGRLSAGRWGGSLLSSSMSWLRALARRGGWGCWRVTVNGSSPDATSDESMNIDSGVHESTWFASWAEPSCAAGSPEHGCSAPLSPKAAGDRRHRRCDRRSSSPATRALPSGGAAQSGPAGCEAREGVEGAAARRPPGWQASSLPHQKHACSDLLVERSSHVASPEKRRGSALLLPKPHVVHISSPWPDRQMVG